MTTEKAPFEHGAFVQRRRNSADKGFVISVRMAGRPAVVTMYSLAGSHGGGIADNWFAESIMPADRAPTDAEVAEFVKFLLTEGEQT